MEAPFRDFSLVPNRAFDNLFIHVCSITDFNHLVVGHDAPVTVISALRATGAEVWVAHAHPSPLGRWTALRALFTDPPERWHMQKRFIFPDCLGRAGREASHDEF
jgi:hypothetical protein